MARTLLRARIKGCHGQAKVGFHDAWLEAHFWSIVVCTRPKSGAHQTVCSKIIARSRANPTRKRFFGGAWPPSAPGCYSGSAI